MLRFFCRQEYKMRLVLVRERNRNIISLVPRYKKRENRNKNKKIELNLFLKKLIYFIHGNSVVVVVPLFHYSLQFSMMNKKIIHLLLYMVIWLFKKYIYYCYYKNITTISIYDILSLSQHSFYYFYYNYC